jgi:hypothetical protein
LLDEIMSIIAADVRAIGEREASEAFDSVKLCSYGKLLATIAKARAEDDKDDELSEEELAQKAEKLLEGMRRARR